jgi:hypothetical protein
MGNVMFGVIEYDAARNQSGLPGGTGMGNHMDMLQLVSALEGLQSGLQASLGIGCPFVTHSLSPEGFIELTVVG